MMPLGPRGAVPVPTLVLDGALAEMKGKCSAGPVPTHRLHVQALICPCAGGLLRFPWTP